MKKDEIIDNVFDEYKLHSGIYKDICRIVLNRFEREQRRVNKNDLLPDVMQQSELLTDFMDMIEAGGMIKFDKPKLLYQFKIRQ